MNLVKSLEQDSRDQTHLQGTDCIFFSNLHYNVCNFLVFTFLKFLILNLK